MWSLGSQPAFPILLTALVLLGCEAPLDLAQVAAEDQRSQRRYDMFQAAAGTSGHLAVVSSTGALVYSDDAGANWQRFELRGRPSLIDVTACADGEFFALDSERSVWRMAPGGDDWQATPMDTPENTLSIYCAPNGRLWVTASFGTLYWTDYQSDLNLDQWREYSLYEDLQFTAVRFVDDAKGFAVGEFGTVITTDDGGDHWQLLEPIPNEFYPMAVDFLNDRVGWVGGLDGVIWQTTDGGESWQRQHSVTTAPIYNLHADDFGVFAVGGSAKLVEFNGDEWQVFEGAPKVLAYMRGLETLADGSLLVAGGNGTLALIPRTSNREG